ncbi:hypothetical protein U9M48_037654 [Paspalum notatum var. saurae]|uniref:Uncharacterized protein n=1 Tax=Paspalum notatum var. saurae TaxID=547442 RepID=A0AAQ3UJM3_PASNO
MQRLAEEYAVGTRWGPPLLRVTRRRIRGRCAWGPARQPTRGHHVLPPPSYLHLLQAAANHLVRLGCFYLILINTNRQSHREKEPGTLLVNEDDASLQMT